VLVLVQGQGTPTHDPCSWRRCPNLCKAQVGKEPIEIGPLPIDYLPENHKLLELSGSQTKFFTFLPTASLQQVQVVGEGVERNAEQELQLLLRGGAIAVIPVERRGLFASPPLGLEAPGE